MKMTPKILFIITLFLGGVAVARPWMSADGKSSFEAKYIRHTEDKVVLVRDGRKLEFLKSYLSKADIEWLNQQKAPEPPKKGVLASHRMLEADEKSWHSYLPSSYKTDGEPSPVCFLYAPGGKSKDVVKRMISTADELGWVLIGIDTYSNERANDGKVSEMAADCNLIRDFVLKEHHVDEAKSVYGGFSGGGWWSFASTYHVDDKAAAVLSFGGWLKKLYDKDYAKGMAVAIINGEDDKAARDWELKDGAFLKKNMQADVKKFHFPGGHELAPSDVCLKAARWIHETKGF